MVKPIAMPAVDIQIKFAPAFHKTKLPAATAANAYLYAIKPLASFTRLSPSNMAITRGCNPRPFVTDVAATASGGETIAPIKNDRGQLIPGIKLYAVTATNAVVKNT